MATLAGQVQDERMARIVLSMIAEPEDPITGYMLARHGGVATLGLAESDRAVTGVPRADVILWREHLRARIPPDLLDRAVEAQRQGFDTLIPADRGWPAGMDDLGDRVPYVLWTKGASSFLTAALSDRVAITGARASSGYGEHVTRELATSLADEQRVVVAGGAYGIEGAAHRAVLAAAGRPIAVLATGLDRRYPAGHRELLDRVGDVGLLVSELPPGTAPTKHRFEARNRLMAALSGAVVIPEAGVRSGSFTTVRNARSLGRGVGAVPGPVTSVASTGPNELIKQGLASVITQASDVIALLDADTTMRDVMSQAAFGRGHRIDRSGPGMPPRSI